MSSEIYKRPANIGAVDGRASASCAPAILTLAELLEPRFTTSRLARLAAIQECPPRPRGWRTAWGSRCAWRGGQRARPPGASPVPTTCTPARPRARGPYLHALTLKSSSTAVNFPSYARLERNTSELASLPVCACSAFHVHVI